MTGQFELASRPGATPGTCPAAAGGFLVALATKATSNEPAPVPDRCQSKLARSTPRPAAVGLARGSEGCNL